MRIRTLVTLLAATGALLGLPERPNAGLDLDAAIAGRAEFQLVVMEAPGCIYCGLFRRDVLPSYEASARAKDVPVRFLDINDMATANLDLQSSVEIVPTFVLVKGNKEVGRIPGYVGPENFYRSINYLILTLP
ncbi:MAG: thioredoxin fold domain-containing protein [Hyphomicrobium sp.]|nr:thioredoxin fold domain-containing protein [Hyphomicrobium sp.]